MIQRLDLDRAATSLPESSRSTPFMISVCLCVLGKQIAGCHAMMETLTTGQQWCFSGAKSLFENDFMEGNPFSAELEKTLVILLL